MEWTFSLLTIILCVVLEASGQKSLTLNIVKKCMPIEKISNFNFVFEDITSDESFNLLFDNFYEKSDIFFSTER